MPLLQKILRLLLYIAAPLSLLLLLSTLTLWPLSHYRSISLEFTVNKSYLSLATFRGRLSLYHATPNRPHAFRFQTGKVDPTYGNWSYFTWFTAPPTPDPPIIVLTSGTLGIETGHSPPIPFMGVTVTTLAIPFLYLSFLFACLPLLAIGSLRHSLRRRKITRLGLCPKCSYDLRTQRSGVAGNVCPECGTPIPPSRIGGA